jgi:uncharacterized protein (DUF2267 family)
VGPILAEVAGILIPNQRIDRLEAYLRLLGQRLDSQDPDALSERLHNPERIDLFEEGAVQSLRAVSDERKEYIASVVSEGLSGEAKDCIQAKRLLRLLAQIDDDQIIILASHLPNNLDDGTFYARHQAVLRPYRRQLGGGRDLEAKIAMYELARGTGPPWASKIAFQVAKKGRDAGVR